MDFWYPNEIELDQASKALLGDVEDTARQINELRPIPADVIRRIQDGLLGMRVFASNAIEGNTLDLRETVMVLETGEISGRRKREHCEARNLGNAARMITGWVDDDVSCHTVERMLQVHKTLLRDISDDQRGRFRDARVMITGATYQPPPASEVPTHVEQLLDHLTHPGDATGDSMTVLLATWAHWGIARIHPFFDGNGRMARLWQDLVLLQGRLTCAIIRPEDRKDYLEALGQADEGDFNPLTQMVAQRVLLTFDEYLAEFRKDARLDSWVETLVQETDVRLEERRKLLYMQWSRMMEQLRLEFEVCASRITDASTAIRIQVRPYDLIDQRSWENIASGSGAKQTWFFTVDCSCRGKRWRYFFFFGKHFWSGLDSDGDRAENRVCLLISEGDASGEKPVRLDQEDYRGPVTLREVFIVDRSLVRKRVNPATGELVYDRDASPLQIAQDFLGDVVSHRLT
ncbi:MAG: Fic family protein [Phycisphaerales bacterium]|nr:MAG: Fic family protein [Phycisphaerales bacterium]